MIDIEKEQPSSIREELLNDIMFERGLDIKKSEKETIEVEFGFFFKVFVRIIDIKINIILFLV